MNDEFAEWEAQEAGTPRDDAEEKLRAENTALKAELEKNREGFLSGERPVPAPPSRPSSLVAPGSPEHRKASIAASLADAEATPSRDEKATRDLKGFTAGVARSIPFFPRIKGFAAGKLAGLAEAFRSATEEQYGRPGSSTVDNSEFADMQTNYLARKEMQRRLEANAAGGPAGALVGGVAGAAALPLAGPLRAAGLTGALPATADAAAVGGLYGASAADREGATAADYARGAGVGAGIGVGGSLAGSALGRFVEGAPLRQDKAFMRELGRTEGGEGAQSLLAADKEALARKYGDVVAERVDPEVRLASRMPTKGAPVRKRPGAESPPEVDPGVAILDRKIQPLAEKNDKLYRELDSKAVRGKGHVGLMTVDRLATELEGSMAGMTATEAAEMRSIITELRAHYQDVAWQGEQVIPARRLRDWLTDVQDDVMNRPGAFNGTQSYKAGKAAMAAATKVVNNYYESIGAPTANAIIRENNRRISALKTIKQAREHKAKKEMIRAMGLADKAAASAKGLEMGAAAGLAASGHIAPAAALVAKRLADGRIRRAMNWADERLIEPLALASEAGNPTAIATRYALERGLPIGSSLAAARGTMSMSDEDRLKLREPMATEPPSALQRAFLEGYR